MGAGGAAGLKASQLARRADVALSVSIVVVLELVNLVSVPLWAGAVVSGASISAGSILADLLLLVLAPLAIGLVIERPVPRAGHELASRTRADLKSGARDRAGRGNLGQLASDRVAARVVVLLASVLIAIVGVVLGALVGRSDAETFVTTGLVSGLRFASLGFIIIGTQLNGNSAFLGPAIVFSLLNLIVVMFLAVEIGRRSGTAAAPDPKSTAAGN